MTVPERETWVRSPFSKDGDCVELCVELGAVRDSKNPHVTLPCDVRTLIAAAKAGLLG